MKKFEGKVALITGAKSGIGKATAVKLAERGARVVLAGRDIDGLAATAKEIGKNAFPVKCDVMSSQDVKNAVAATVSTFGGLDILFNNSGVLNNILITEMAEDEFDRIMRTNLYSVFYGIKHAAPEIAKRGGGAIINNASTGGLLGAAYMSAYSASKAGVINLTRCAALELRAQNIRVNCVLPGIVDTPMAGRGEKTHASVQDATDALVMAKQGRWIESDDVANAVLYLASDDSVCVTGSNITVDCGMSASLY